jgi:hypothetical protein
MRSRPLKLAVGPVWHGEAGAHVCMPAFAAPDVPTHHVLPSWGRAQA